MSQSAARYQRTHEKQDARGGEVDMKSIGDIIMDAGMSARPEYYSGRGAMVCDLNSRHLEKIYAGIKSEHGDDAARNFVLMVSDLPKLSATDFLLALYALSCDWKWSPSMAPTSNGVYAGDIGSALGTIASVLGGMSRIDQTESIRGEFIRAHRAELPESRQRNGRDSEIPYSEWGTW